MNTLLALTNLAGHHDLLHDQTDVTAGALTLYKRLGVAPTEASVMAPLRARMHLERCLINTVVSVRPGDRSPGSHAVNVRYAWKLFVVGYRQLYNARSSVVETYLREAFEIAERAELFQLARLTAGLLRYLYANRMLDLEKFHFYTGKMRIYAERQEDQLSVDNTFVHLEHLNVNGASITDRIAYLNDALQRLTPLREKYANTEIAYNLYLLELELYAISNTPNRLVEHCRNAIAYLQSWSGSLPAHYTPFETRLTLHFMEAGQFFEARRYGNSLLERQQPGSFNYFKAAELLMTVALQARYYKFAAEFYEAHEENLQLRPQHEPAFLGLDLIESYLKLLYRLGWVGSRRDDSVLNSKFSRGASSCNRLYADYDCYQFHLLIQKALAAIHVGRYASAEKSIDCLHREWRKLLPRRGRIFIDLLRTASRQDYHRTAVKRHAKNHLERLRSTPVDTKSDTDDLIEIIPFEDLWDILLEILLQRRVKRRAK